MSTKTAAAELSLVSGAKPLPLRWVNAKRHVERDEESKRPFRLWLTNGAAGGSFARWRYFSHLRSAHLGALIECRWAHVGTTIEVIDLRNHKQWGSYTRRVDEIRFIGGDNIPKDLE